MAYGINDAGQIVGSGTRNGKIRGFILTPESIAAPPQIKLSTAALSLTEGGATGTYTAVLTHVPRGDVTVTLSPDQQLSTNATTLAFTVSNWNTPQTVSVNAIQDGIAEGKHTGTITHTVTSGDTRYNGIAVSKLTAAITDAAAPTVKLPFASGTISTQPDLSLSGTAAPGVTVTLTLTNLSTGEVRAVSAVADANGNWNVTLTGLTDGNYELQPEADGVTGTKIGFAIDSHAPVSTLSVTAGTGPNAAGWYTVPVNIALTATDGTGGQGVARSEYTLDGSAWTAFPATGLTISTDGSHNVCYRSVDNAGNIEAARCVTIAIDTAAPQVTPFFDTATNTLNLNAQDAGSGIASIETSIDGGATWNTQTGPVTFTRDGSYAVQYRVRDKAGNLASGQTTVTVATIPAITAPANQTASEGASQTFNLGSFTDLPGDNPWSVEINWGDNSAPASFMLNTPGNTGALPHAYSDSGTYTVTVKITDQAGNTGSKTFPVAVANAAPTASLAAGTAVEGGSTTIALTNPGDASSADTLAGFHYAFACDGASLAAATYTNSGTASSTACTYADGPAASPVRARIIDKDGGFTEYTGSVTINNVNPVVGGIAAPADPVLLNTAVTVTAGFSDAGVLDTHAAVIDWGDGGNSAGSVSETNGSGSATGSHTYALPGAYTVTVTVTDKDGGSGTAGYQDIVVIDPNGASVNGNGRIDSPTGAMPGNPSAGGKTRLQMKADYKGGTVPAGDTSFDFDGGNLHFQSTAYAWLVASGAKATVKGSGTVNGAGGYGFLVSVIEGGKGKSSPDLMRMKIWNQASGQVVYDSQPGAPDSADPVTPVESGKISVH